MVVSGLGVPCTPYSGAFTLNSMPASCAGDMPDIETCSECSGTLKVIACIEDPAVIKKILAHLDEKVASAGTGLLPECRTPPRRGLFDGT